MEAGVDGLVVVGVCEYWGRKIDVLTEESNVYDNLMSFGSGRQRRSARTVDRLGAGS